LIIAALQPGEKIITDRGYNDQNFFLTFPIEMQICEKNIGKA
jgi:hypothetical protein